MKKTSISFLLLFSSALPAQNLLETYDLALQNDPILRRSLANKMAVAESKDQSIAQLLPSVNAGASSGYNWSYQNSFLIITSPDKLVRTIIGIVNLPLI
ncbi:TolC family protein [Methyloprofundus sedimenti]|uniref:TolC family protein n=1 Tax=Methyloprofundus sedimenti TaxID=1420851 RepID=UPI001E5E3AF9|nr:TolC family protein [Methyloprofundus sedimenti]